MAIVAWEGDPQNSLALNGFSEALMMEVRYDGKTSADSGMSADVSFDDLYLGTQAGNPNRPED